uniref:Uncharacterized protein n=1 Tax=Setaria viridis TaxID=4556 RepID=A0A4U6T4M2_SETVI|nr:hypothetical protein SEVIR_9G359250v2 [Setaria viridis]
MGCFRSIFFLDGIDSLMYFVWLKNLRDQRRFLLLLATFSGIHLSYQRALLPPPPQSRWANLSARELVPPALGHGRAAGGARPRRPRALPRRRGSSSPRPWGSAAVPGELAPAGLGLRRAGSSPPPLRPALLSGGSSPRRRLLPATPRKALPAGGLPRAAMGSPVDALGRAATKRPRDGG